MSTAAKRILQRIEELGTNASAVSLQAGLGRSSVRDILSGKAQNPRIDTLQKLAVPLACSVEFLLGEADTPGLAPRAVENNAQAVDPTWQASVVWVVELGVFRTPKIGPEGQELTHARFLEKPRTVAFNPSRHDGWGLYQMNDDTLTKRGIFKGDFLTAEEPFTEIAALNPGEIIIIKRWIGENPAEELSARVVAILDGDIALTTASGAENAEPIVLKDPPSPDIADAEKDLYNVYFLPDGKITIEGIVFRVTRDLR
jgi:transcriptional regulator with XRE-family HTH domain